MGATGRLRGRWFRFLRMHGAPSDDPAIMPSARWPVAGHRRPV